MSRRDTIIIAVLVNAGILLVLFALAMPSKEQPESATIVAEKTEGTVQHPEPQTLLTEAGVEKTAVVDEIDQVLSEWNEQSQVAPVAIAEEAVAVSYPLESPKEADTVTSEKNDKTVEVVVKKGDALDKIARSHGTTAQEIMKLNHLASSKLQIGQVLLVPGKAKVKSSASKIKVPVSKAKGDLYTVKSGDNPWTIANKNHIKLEELLKLNDLNEDTAKKLKPGDKIRIK